MNTIATFHKQIPLILGLDFAGVPLRWLSWEDAVSLQIRGQVAWSAGRETFRFHGGINYHQGVRSVARFVSSGAWMPNTAFLKH